jgi:uncharacterized protein (TIGR00369 family)
MTEVQPGMAEITLPFREALTQQHGFIHAGIITAIADSACGYAALSLMPPGVGVLTIEFKVNLLNPAAGERFVARGRVVKPGARLWSVPARWSPSARMAPSRPLRSSRRR